MKNLTCPLCGGELVEGGKIGDYTEYVCSSCFNRIIIPNEELEKEIERKVDDMASKAYPKLQISKLQEELNNISSLVLEIIDKLLIIWDMLGEYVEEAEQTIINKEVE